MHQDTHTHTFLILLNPESVRLPWVDAADHILREQAWSWAARSCGFRQKQYDQTPHLKAVLAVEDEASAEQKPQIKIINSIKSYAFNMWISSVI